MYWKLAILCITRDFQLLSDILNVTLVTRKSYHNKYSLVELGEKWTLVKATQKWYRLERVCWTFSWWWRSFEIWMSRSTTINSVWHNTKLLCSTWRINVVFDPERHRAFPGTTSMWTVITGWICRRATSKEESIYTMGRFLQSICGVLAMKKLLACLLA